MTLSACPAGGTLNVGHDLPHDHTMLNQPSHRHAVSSKTILGNQIIIILMKQSSSSSNIIIIIVIHNMATSMISMHICVWI